MKKGVIYTCISGDYDSLKDFLVVREGWDYVCFSDSVQRTVYNQSWQIKPLAFKELDDVRNARWHKINPHKLFKNYKYSVWIDANIDVVRDDFYLEIDKHIERSEQFAVMKHPERDCIYDEATVILDAQMDDPRRVKSQVKKIRELKFPEHAGLIVSCILLRKHGDKVLINAMEEWWRWVRDFSRRDQLSLNFVLWRHNFSPRYLPFVYKNPGQSGPLYWRRHDFISRKTSLSREKYISQLEAIVYELKGEKARLEVDISLCRYEKEKILLSKSWRLTSPFRATLRVLRSIYRKKGS